mmetsp:Transcript_23206/g.56321  ORF Transcript_23206/g.56321 Transcript_23206/m.56321 type:complete len:292 (+) Transcript_23206:2173-3048(+)
MQLRLQLLHRSSMLLSGLGLESKIRVGLLNFTRILLCTNCTDCGRTRFCCNPYYTFSIALRSTPGGRGIRKAGSLTKLKQPGEVPNQLIEFSVFLCVLLASLFPQCLDPLDMLNCLLQLRRAAVNVNGGPLLRFRSCKGWLRNRGGLGENILCRLGSGRRSLPAYIDTIPNLPLLNKVGSHSVIERLRILAGNLAQNILYSQSLWACEGGQKLRNPQEPDPGREMLGVSCEGHIDRAVIAVVAKQPQDTRNQQSSAVLLMTDGLEITHNGVLGPLEILLQGKNPVTENSPA